MPVGYLVPVVLISWGVACALTTWRRLGPVAALPALLVNELPFIVGLWLAASTALALADGDLGDPAGKAVFGVAVLAGAGLAVIVRRALRAHDALGIAGPPRRPWGRIVRAPFFAGRRDVVQARACRTPPRRQRLDVHYRRDRPVGAPVLVHFHGGGFRSGSKSREALPLIRHLVSRRGFVCVSAGYRLQPQVQLEDQVADVRAAIAWVRAHGGEFGADPSLLTLTGSSAGAYLAVRAVLDGEPGVGAVVGRYGYYGHLADPGPAEPAAPARRSRPACPARPGARLRRESPRHIPPPGHVRGDPGGTPRLRHVRVDPSRSGRRRRRSVPGRGPC